MEKLKFFNPEYLNLLWIVLPAVLLMAEAYRKRLKYGKTISGIKMYPVLAASLSKKKIILKRILCLSSVILLITALAGPQIGSKLVKVKRQGIDIVVTIDLSRSMTAQDITPSRLKKTKHEVKNFINRLEGDRIALVGFTSRAFVQCPLTSDYDAALMFLDMMDTSLMPQDGTSLSEAIKTSSGVFTETEKKHKLMVIVSDGEDHEKGIEEAVAEAKEKGIVIYTVGVGSPEGVPIPTGQGFLKDETGKTVITRLNEIDLKKIAMEGKGNYYYSSTGESDLAEIFSDIGKLEKRDYDERTFKDYEHRFQVLLMIALLLLFADLFISERKKEVNGW